MPEPLAPGVWEPAQGSLYSLQGNHSVLRLADRLGIPNGLDWSTDQRTFYHVDSLDYAVHAYDYDVQAGTIGEHPGPHAGLGDRPRDSGGKRMREATSLGYRGTGQGHCRQSDRQMGD